MTERKPPGMSFEGWIERQIRVAQERGEFDDLPGAGEPLPSANRRTGALDWIANKLRTENVDTAALLPPSLALPKEIERLPERLGRERSEQRVREIVEDLNERIRHAHAQPQVGPPLRARTVDVDQAVRDWRRARGTE